MHVHLHIYGLDPYQEQWQMKFCGSGYPTTNIVILLATLTGRGATPMLYIIIPLKNSISLGSQQTKMLQIP